IRPIPMYRYLDDPEGDLLGIGFMTHESVPTRTRPGPMSRSHPRRCCRDPARCPRSYHRHGAHARSHANGRTDPRRRREQDRRRNRPTRWSSPPPPVGDGVAEDDTGKSASTYDDLAGNGGDHRAASPWLTYSASQSSSLADLRSNSVVAHVSAARSVYH